MSAAKLHVVSPEPLADSLRSGSLNRALTDLAGLANLGFVVQGPRSDDEASTPATDGPHQVPIRYRGSAAGRIVCDPAGEESKTARAAAAVSSLLEHMLDREMAVGDLAEALITGYEELNLLYTLLPTIATKVDPTEVGNALVGEAAKILGCRRVSLSALGATGPRRPWRT